MMEFLEQTCRWKNPLMKTEFDKLYDKATHVPKISPKKTPERKPPPKV